MDTNEIDRIIINIHNPDGVVKCYKQELVRIRVSSWNCNREHHRRLTERAKDIRLLIEHFENMNTKKII